MHPKYNEYEVFKRFLYYFEFGKKNECWEWKGCRHIYDQYGRFIWAERQINYAHIASYEFFIGTRHGLQVCHTCDNPPCINPNHLFLGTQDDNIKDMDKKGRRRNHYGPNPATGHPGEENSQAIITWEIVRKLRRKYATGNYTYRELGLRYKCSPCTVADLIKKRHWIE